MTYTPSKPEKLCVFCGRKPDGKSKEHVLPRWLIQRTGSPKRQVALGERRRDGKAQIRVFAFDQFTFPACEKCNSDHSDLENRAGRIVELLLTDQPLLEGECDTFLDWLDKVRIGVWLGNRYLTDNWADIDPNFHIAERIGAADRMAWIMRADDLQEGLSVMGAQTPLFSMMPSVFGLRINHLLILSASSDLMLSRPLGLPWAKRRWTELGKRGLGMELTTGEHEIAPPLFPVAARLAALELYQPMFRKFREAYPGLYDNDYVHDLTLSASAGRGHVFVDGFDGLQAGGVDAADYLRSKGFGGGLSRVGEFGATVLEVQNALVRQGASFGRLPPRIRRLEAKRWRIGYAINERFIDAFLNGRLINSMAEVDDVNAGKFRAHAS